MPNTVISKYYDGLESEIRDRARSAGLLGHGTMIGDAREFFVAEVLGRIMPPTVEIGRGKVIDGMGGQSKQIDIVVFDKRFPRFKIGNDALYPVEGVLATVEVKSQIDRDGLNDGIDNCNSVLSLVPVLEYPEQADKHIKWLMASHNWNARIAKAVFDFRYRPATYIFGYNSTIDAETLMGLVTGRVNTGPKVTCDWLPLLPRMIAIGHSIGIMNDGRIDVRTTSDMNADGSYKLFTYFEAGNVFRWLAMHLSYTVHARLGAHNYMEDCTYSIGHYYPFEDYIEKITSKKTMKTVITII